MAPVRVGTKRDRDDRREQLQQRLDEAERVNATPARDESPASKRRRTNRRHQAQKRFRTRARELDLLSQQVNNGSFSERQHVPVTIAVAPGAAPTLSTSSAGAIRMSDAERARLRRANMTSSQRERTRQKNAERQRLRRAQRRAEEVEADRERNRIAQQIRRDLHGEANLVIDSERQATRRSQLSQQDRDSGRQIITEARALRRSQQTEDERKEEREANAVRDADRERQAVRRVLQTEEEREEERERVRERRRTTRHRDALANYEDFRPSMVTAETACDPRDYHERHGQDVFIPRIVFLSDGDTREFPFRLRRKQFPVQPAFAMTINKAQGQTLYVALSRVTARSRLKVMIEYPEHVEDDGAYTQNVVYRQIFEM
ncbi:hypothetical protein F443_10106 [Phytophthora nicotianae P1569]|uniref:Helitron helicase-like domain-containing protein n=1 Tax=Phytophthora nicotianae P1569 TaxID=1317065 RepID=V9F139_PHYNI|nr:hypothetical protein F443_10106 [Phytophthora nicotianae P1569]